MVVHGMEVWSICCAVALFLCSVCISKFICRYETADRRVAELGVCSYKALTYLASLRNLSWYSWVFGKGLTIRDHIILLKSTDVRQTCNKNTPLLIRLVITLRAIEFCRLFRQTSTMFHFLAHGFCHGKR